MLLSAAGSAGDPVAWSGTIPDGRASANDKLIQPCRASVGSEAHIHQQERADQEAYLVGKGVELCAGDD